MGLIPTRSLLVERYEHPFRRCEGRGTPYAQQLGHCVEVRL
jgi:hypothetical protein